MKKNIKDGLFLGFGLWILTLILGLPLVFLQFGYNPRYLLQLLFVMALLVRCCKKNISGNWLSLLTLECLVLITALIHVLRSGSTAGAAGLGMLISGVFFGGVSLVCLTVSLVLYFVKRKESK